MKPLSFSQKRLLSVVESNPGLSRSELGQLLYQEMNPYYSLKKVLKQVSSLLKRGLVELDVIHEGGRTGVQGVYLVGKPRPDKPGYLGVFGRVDNTVRSVRSSQSTGPLTNPERPTGPLLNGSGARSLLWV